jgi:hypothetical protein
MDDLQGRGKALENLFFENRDQELLQKIKSEIEGKEIRIALGAVSGIDNTEVLDGLMAIGVSPESLSAVSLIPLVAVAWSDKSMAANEKDAILKAADAAGIAKDSASFDLLGSWLEANPKSDLLDAWKAYVGVLKTTLDETSLSQLKASVLNRAESIAEAAGGFLGIGSVSDAERNMIAQLSQAFGE